jgi:hypothetical protein
VKGSALAAQRLRPLARRSGDVDVLVNPAAFERFCEAMESHGWIPNYDRQRDPSVPFVEISLHSVTFRHPAWPCTVDAHFMFPGLLTDPQRAFDALWERRTTVTIAGREVTTCDVLGNAIIAAVHGMRDLRFEQHRSELAYLTEQLDQRLDDEERRELAILAADVGAADTIRPLLDDLGCPRIGTSDPEMLKGWQLRTSTGGERGVLWLGELAREPVHRWPRILRNGLWPPEQNMRLSWDVGEGRFGLFRARVARLAHVLTLLPNAVRVLWRNRQYVR